MFAPIGRDHECINDWSRAQTLLLDYENKATISPIDQLPRKAIKILFP